MTVNYNLFWDNLPDFIKYNPGARHRRRLSLKVLRDLKFKKVLDVGCGSGELIDCFQKNLQDVQTFVGTDISEPQIEKNKKNFSSVRFQKLDIQSECLNEEFDLVSCCEVVEHLQNQKEAIKNLAKMVAPGGYLLITCPSGKIHQTEKHFGHLKHPDPHELTSDLKKLGLELTSGKNWGWPFYKTLKWATNLNPEWSLKTFTGSYSPFAKFISNSLYFLNYVNFSNHRGGVQLIALYQKLE